MKSQSRSTNGAALSERETSKDRRTSQEQDPRLAMLTVAQRFLKPNPDWWISLTFERPTVTTSVAVDSFRCWLSRWRRADQSATGVKPGRSPLSRLFWCAETQSRGAAHIHALAVNGHEITSPHCARCFERTGYNRASFKWWVMKEAWFTHHGIARIYPFDSTRAAGVVAYLVKYMFKETDPEWGLWDEAKGDF